MILSLVDLGARFWCKKERTSPDIVRLPNKRTIRSAASFFRDGR